MVVTSQKAADEHFGIYNPIAFDPDKERKQDMINI